MESLAVKYRPKTFDNVVCQNEVKTILQNQIETGEYKQAYLFCGSAGTGKTTSARIFANEIRQCKGKVVEIDGASNNGVDNVRGLIDDTKMKAIDGGKKIYIIDEVHMLSQGAFNALLKVLEEPPKDVLFILATTDPQKIPGTILSRCQRFDFTRIPTESIYTRLEYIIREENKEIVHANCGSRDAIADDNWAIKEGIPIIEFDSDALMYIAKLANGGMRDAIMKLDTVLGFTRNITLEAVENCLGAAPQYKMYKLLWSIIYRNPDDIIPLVRDINHKIFVRDFFKFVLDVSKYSIMDDYTITNISNEYKKGIDEILGYCNITDIMDILDRIKNLNSEIRFAEDVKTLVESELLLLCY